MKDYTSTYNTARGIARIVSLIGWLTIIGCLIGSLISAAALSKVGKDPIFIVVGILPWLGGMISGIFLVGTGQFMRTSVDTADNTGQILSFLQKQQYQNTEIYNYLQDISSNGINIKNIKPKENSNSGINTNKSKSLSQTCPSCKTPNSIGNDTCFNCGKSLSLASDKG